LETGGLKKESFRQNFLRGLGQADALLLVLPYFQEEHRHRVLTLAKEIETEFILCDLLGVESRSAKISRDLARGVKGEIQKEAEILERCRIALENEVSLRQVKFSEEELKHIRGFAFLSQKPLLTALNLAEEDLNRQSEILQEAQLSEAIPIGAKIEAEISDLAEADRELFLQDLGIMQSARERIIAQTRISLDLITFLTASEKEAHAWSLKRGANALKAAGVIHSDMEKGFIRAEVFPFEELNKYPFLHDLRAKGLIRLEGKDYIVQEGDVILFRFSI
jgi:ribosome-binding ATPase YchF (GTP1/OBG family)